MRGNNPDPAAYEATALFQFTPLHERQRIFPSFAEISSIFQFTPLHERQPWWSKHSNASIYFNSCLYMRGILFLFWIINVVCFQFQFMPLHERQRSTVDGTSYSGSFQFTPLHERQRSQMMYVCTCMIFQFTPLHERQRVGRVHTAVWEYFNSRLCMRGNITNIKQSIADIISIHASAWEATVLCNRGMQVL